MDMRESQVEYDSTEDVKNPYLYHDQDAKLISGAYSIICSLNFDVKDIYAFSPLNLRHFGVLSWPNKDVRKSVTKFL